MKTLAQTSNTFDIYFDTGTGQLATVEGKDAYKFIIADAIRTIRGELQLDLERGIPYFATVFRDANSMAIWRSFVDERVREFEFVKNIKEFTSSFDRKTRQMDYVLVIETDLGDVTIDSTEVIGPEDEGGGEGMGGLVQDGKFYLPVWKREGVQYYRLLTDAVEDETNLVTTDISETLYIKVNGRFEPVA